MEKGIVELNCGIREIRYEAENRLVSGLIQLFLWFGADLRCFRPPRILGVGRERDEKSPKVESTLGLCFCALALYLELRIFSM